MYTVYDLTTILSSLQLKLFKKPALSTTVETAWLAAGSNRSSQQHEKIGHRKAQERLSRRFRPKLNPKKQQKGS